jgi:magnesium-transporting ATPase (P-type)
MGKPSRPFGLSLAITAGLILFTVLPLTVTALLLYIRSYIYRNEGGALGGASVTNVSDTPFVILIVVGIFFLFVSIFAWRGRPRQMRWLYPAVVLAYTAVVVLGVALPAVTTPPSLEQGLDSGQDLARRVLSGYSGACLALGVFTVWFANRWSARAFFRGYYTDKDRALMEEMGYTPPVA